MKSFNIPLTEAAFTAMIRCCATQNRPVEALSLYEDMLTCEIMPRVRSLSALLALLAQHKEVQQCERIFHDLLHRFELIPTEKEYASMLILYSSHCHNYNNSSSHGEEKGGEGRVVVVEEKKGKFVEYLTSLMEDLLVLSHQETIDIIMNWFQQNPNHYSLTYSEVSKNGLIECNQEELKSIDLTSSSREKLVEQLEGFAVNRDPNHRHKPNNKIRNLIKPTNASVVSSSSIPLDHNGNAEAITEEKVSLIQDNQEEKALQQRINIWSAYKTWLEEHQDFDLIVDGANIGYYKQNYHGAPKHVAYDQIDHMINLLLAQNKKPLLILHSRHLAADMVPNTETLELINKWRKTILFYPTPRKFNDDWFWMFAAIKYHRPVLTNDDMRDHHFQLFRPRYFLQWRERYRVTYEMFSCFHGQSQQEHDEQQQGNGQTDSDESKNAVRDSSHYLSRTIRMFVHWPRPYSHRIQHVDGKVYEGWYFPPLVPSLPNASMQDEEDNESDNMIKEDGGSIDDHSKIAAERSAEVNDDNNKPASNTKWLCIYRRKDESKSTPCTGEKRKRVDDDNESEG
eukprot:scaffold1190_cov187-Ochromonas_danica.AAC.37